MERTRGVPSRLRAQYPPGVVKTALYWHFESKRGLLSAALERAASTWIEQIQQGTLSIELAKQGLDEFLAHLRGMTKAEIHTQAVAQKWLIAPVNLAPDLLADPQLRSRDFWIDVDGTTVPGAFAKLSKTPIRYRGPAPKLGADQHVVDAPTARLVAKMIEYPIEGVPLEGPGWPWHLTLAPLGLAMVGAMGAFALSRRRRAQP